MWYDEELEKKLYRQRKIDKIIRIIEYIIGWITLITCVYNLMIGLIMIGLICILIFILMGCEGIAILREKYLQKKSVKKEG